MQVLALVKQNLDQDIKLNITSKDLSDHIAIVTGANSGTGYSVSKLLVSLGATVVMACRNQDRCEAAGKLIIQEYPGKQELVIPMILDLNDLASVRQFSKDFQKKFKRLDILINNAGLIAQKGSVTVQGLEQSFGIMHIGHFALTKYLLKLMLKPISTTGKNTMDAARIINLSSDALLAGNFHPSLMIESGGGDLMTEITDNCRVDEVVDCCPMFACPNTNGYARAKLANMMHIYELQRRVDEYILQQSSNNGYQSVSKSYRRLVTASLHPGSVNTNISSFLSSQVTGLFLRNSEQAAYIILHAILDDSFIPSAYIDGMRYSHDFFDYQEKHLYKHFTAFPESRNLPFAYNKKIKNQFSLHDILWNYQTLIYPIIEDNINIISNNNDNNKEQVVNIPPGIIYRKDTVAARLWDISEQIVSDWEAKRPILKTNVSTIVSTKLKL